MQQSVLRIKSNLFPFSDKDRRTDSSIRRKNIAQPATEENLIMNDRDKSELSTALSSF